MTRDVYVTISGTHMQGKDAEDVEVITPAIYLTHDGMHTITYDEHAEGMSGVTKNTITITDRKMDIIKEGIANAHMSFESGAKSMTMYSTPFGDLLMGIDTHKMSIDKTEDRLKVEVDYSMEIEQQHISDCNIIVDVCSKSAAHIDLTS